MSERGDLRERIVRAAAQLLSGAGRNAVSTRAVSAAAGVQAPAIYRQFADMNELLHAAAREVLAGYVRKKAGHPPAADPVEELRRGWDVHVAFGLANPAAYALVYGDGAAYEGEEMREGMAMLHGVVARVAEAGRLGVSVPHAAQMVHAGACGVTLSLIGMRPKERDLRLSDAMREAVLAAILVAAPNEPARDRLAARAVALHALLRDADALSSAEKQLMEEWLVRLSDDYEAPAPAKGKSKRR